MDTSSAETGSSQTMNLRVEGQRPGNADALAAAAVQLMGVGVVEAPGQAHSIHQLRHPLLPSRPGLAQLDRSSEARR